VVKYPANTGSLPLDNRLAREMAARFGAAEQWALNLVCRDFFGCDDECRPIGLEIKHHVQQSGRRYLSAFRVERFNGNYRRNAHLKGTVEYSFHNYRLKDGGDVTLEEIFRDPKKSLPLFWEQVERALSATGNCGLSRFKVNNRRINRSNLSANDILLSRGGATIALEAPSPCRPQAVDLSSSEMIRLGASPDLWSWQ
jgi:hypothetical protein